MMQKFTIPVFILLFIGNTFSQETDPALKSTDRLNIEWWKDRHQEKTEIPQVNPKLVLLGDSIFHTLDYADTNEVWGAYLNKYRTINLGFSGDRTENVIWRLENGEIDHVNPKLILLLIGTNNTDGNHFLSITQPKELQEAIWKITRIIRKKLPETKILLLGIFPYGYKANLRDNLNKATNVYLESFPEKDHMIFYRDVGNVFLDKNGKIDKNLMPDYLHPNAKGHLLLFKALFTQIEELTAE